MAAKIKKGDQVIILAGKNKGMKGEVTSVIPAKNQCIVQGANVVKRHQKPSQANPEGGIITKELPIDLSNVALVDPETNTATRVGFVTMENGAKVRQTKKSKSIVEDARKSK